MTSLHKITLSKIACLGMLILASKIVPANPAELDDLSTTPNNSPTTGIQVDSTDVPQSQNDDKNFRILMEKINHLKIKGNANEWYIAIQQYIEDSSLKFDNPTLDNLKGKILNEELTSGRYKKVKRVFNYLSDNKESLSNKKSTTAQELVLLVLGPEDLAEMGFGNLLEGDDGEEDAEAAAAAVEKVKTGKEDQSLSKSLLSSVQIAKLAPTTVAIRDHLKTIIAGQDVALGALSSLAHRYMCNKLLVDCKQKPAGRPSHCILTGPTGCGKSETLCQLGKFLSLPILHINARCLTDEGYKGFNFSEAVCNFSKANKAPKFAMVAIDEIDKLASSGGGEEKNFGQAVQRVLLSCLDGNPVCKDGASYDISNWWFVCAGAFSAFKGLHDGCSERATTAKTHEDIIAYGFEPEFVGRFSTVISLSGHTLETMLGVINKEGSPLSQAKNEFKTFYGIELSFEEKALRLLAESSIKIGLGVRSLHTVLNEILQPLYETASIGGISGCLTIKESEVLPVIEKMKKDRKKSKKDEPPFGMYM